MKDLLAKLTRSNVSICFKSGEKINNVVIESVMDKSIIANVNGEITIIEIPHIAYVSAEAGLMEIMETILKETNTQEESNSSSSNSNSSQDSEERNNEKDSEKNNKDEKKDDSKNERNDDRKEYRNNDRRNESRYDKKEDKRSFGY